MTRTLTLTTLAALLAATTAHAADTRSSRLATIDAEPAARPVATRIDGERIRYESEAQFLRDYGAQAERLAPGVYLMNTGPFAGKTVSMGIDGLAYDLAVLQARARKTGLKAAERGELQKRIAELQKLAREYEARQIREGFSSKASRVQSFSCFGYDWWQNRQVFYGGVAEVYVDGGLYLDRGNGSYNWYYSRMQAAAVVNVYPPGGGYWPNVGTNAYATVRNEVTGQTINATPQYLAYSAAAATGFLYNGPTFSHHLTGRATATASGDCFVYLSLDDVFQQ